MSIPTTQELASREPSAAVLSTDFPHRPGEHGFPDPPDPFFDLKESTCGPTWDGQDVEAYDGSGNAPIEYVNLREQSTCLIRWVEQFPTIWSDPRRIAGGARCSGTLIGHNLMLTAAHCLERSQDNPTFWLFDDDGNPITPPEAALFMQCDFNFQRAAPDLNQIRPIESFRIAAVLEYRPAGLDIALLRVEGSPGGKYGWREMTERSPADGDRIVIIQHPGGQPKQVATGTVESLRDTMMQYVDLDTRGGSSGAGVLDVRGEIVGVHIEGGCNAPVIDDPDQDNDATRLDSALAASPVLRQMFERRPGSAIASSPDGFFVVAWEEDNDENGFSEIRAAIGHAGGGLSVGDLQVNVQPWGQQRNPSVVIVDDMFVVAWEDDADQNGFFNINMRGFSLLDGSERFPTRQVHQNAAGQQLHPRLATVGAGRFVAVWEHDPDRNRFFNIRMRGFDKTGEEVLPEFMIHQVGVGQQRRPSVAAANNRIAVVWEDDRDNNGTFRTFVRTFDENGTSFIDDLAVSPVSGSGQQLFPKVAINDAGSLVVTWSGDADANSFFNVRMKALDYRGRELISARQVHQNGAGNQRRSAPGFVDQDKFVVAWEDDVDGNGYTNVYMAGFDLAGTRLWDDLSAHKLGNGNQRNPSISLGQNTVLIAVESDEQLDGTYNMLVNGFHPNGKRRFIDLKIDR